MPPPPDRLASPMAGPTSEPRAWLEAESLLNLCRLAVKHGVSIDTCETKEAVVQVLLAVGEGLLGQPGAFQPSPSATPMDVDEEPGGQGGLPQDAGSGLNAGRPPLGGVQLNSQGRTPPGFMSAGDAFKLARQQQEPRIRGEPTQETRDAAVGPAPATTSAACLEEAPAVANRVVPMRTLVRIGSDGQPCFFAPIVEEPPAMSNASVLRRLVEFVHEKQFFWFAPVCRSWRAAWGQRPASTCVVYRDTSVSQLRRTFELGLPRFVVDLESLARAGNTEMLGRARRAGCKWTKSTAAAAALAGQGRALRYLLMNGCPFDSSLCSSAARGGHLGLLRWLRRKQFPWDRTTITEAIRAGHLAVLKWAMAHGCRWTVKFLVACAEAGGNPEMVEWVKKLHAARKAIYSQSKKGMKLCQRGKDSVVA